MDRKTAQDMLNRMKEIVAAEFPEYTAQFGRTTYEGIGTISFKFDLADKSAQNEIAQRDQNIGLAKNKVHPNAIGMTFDFNGATYVVESVKKRKQKYSVVCKDERTEKRSRFMADHINRLATEQFGTSVRYVGNMAILTEVE